MIEYIIYAAVFLLGMGVGIVLRHIAKDLEFDRMKDELLEYRVEYYKTRSMGTNMRKESYKDGRVDNPDINAQTAVEAREQMYERAKEREAVAQYSNDQIEAYRRAHHDANVRHYQGTPKTIEELYQPRRGNGG